MANACWFLNVRLETGYETGRGEVTRTKTDLFHLRIEDGAIAEIVRASDRPHGMKHFLRAAKPGWILCRPAGNRNRYMR